MVEEPQEILEEKDFFEEEVIIRKQILDNAKLSGAQKKNCLTVLEGV